MSRLDCSAPNPAIASLATLLGVGERELVRRLDSVDEASLLHESRRTRRPPEDALTRCIAGSWPEDIAPPAEVVWFHGTRLSRSTDFREGLLPFNATLPRLTSAVEELALEVGVARVRLHMGEMSGSHSMKVALGARSGPYGSLLRETVVRPTGAHRDFLDTPEIVFDLAHSVGGTSAPAILDLYRQRTCRCVVWFVARDPRRDVTKFALMYAWSCAQSSDDPGYWNTCFNGGGIAVPSSDIVKIEWLDQ
jgi:hypothetical protein